MSRWHTASYSARAIEIGSSGVGIRVVGHAEEVTDALQRQASGTDAQLGIRLTREVDCGGGECRGVHHGTGGSHPGTIWLGRVEAPGAATRCGSPRCRRTRAPNPARTSRGRPSRRCAPDAAAARHRTAGEPGFREHQKCRHRVDRWAKPQGQRRRAGLEEGSLPSSDIHAASSRIACLPTRAISPSLAEHWQLRAREMWLR